MKNNKYLEEGSLTADGWAQQSTSWSVGLHHEQICPRSATNLWKVPHCSRWDTLYLLITMNTKLSSLSMHCILSLTDVSKNVAHAWTNIRLISGTLLCQICMLFLFSSMYSYPLLSCIISHINSHYSVTLLCI